MITLDAENLKEFENYLKERNWIEPTENVVNTEVPGEGNMNYTRRIKTNIRTFIIKQSRGYVEKYPQVKAPDDRILMEAEFYELTQHSPVLTSFTPKIFGVDVENRIMVMEDLGEGNDFTDIYKKGSTLSNDDIDVLLEFLTTLHCEVNLNSTNKTIVNEKMRELNHGHIFDIPFQPNNGLNLDDIQDGLAEAARPFQNDEELRKAARELGKLYLDNGSVLLHGDYFPGSWLKTAQGIRIIDPEFCFFGPGEFDLGVMIAHLKMAQQEQNLIDYCKEKYSTKLTFDTGLIDRFTGVEILRRIMGLAQLPLDLSLAERKTLMQEAAHLLKG